MVVACYSFHIVEVLLSILLLKWFGHHIFHGGGCLDMIVLLEEARAQNQELVDFSTITTCPSSRIKIL